MSNVDRLIEMMLLKHEEDGLAEIGLDVPAGMFPEDLAALLLLLDKAMREAVPYDLQADGAEGTPVSGRQRPPSFLRMLNNHQQRSLVRLRLLPGLGADHMRSSILSACARRGETVH